jgi:hypothetical protein
MEVTFRSDLDIYGNYVIVGTLGPFKSKWIIPRQEMFGTYSGVEQAVNEAKAMIVRTLQAYVGNGAVDHVTVDSWVPRNDWGLWVARKELNGLQAICDKYRVGSWEVTTKHSQTPEPTAEELAAWDEYDQMED